MDNRDFLSSEHRAELLIQTVLELFGVSSDDDNFSEEMKINGSPLEIQIKQSSAASPKYSSRKSLFIKYSPPEASYTLYGGIDDGVIHVTEIVKVHTIGETIALSMEQIDSPAGVSILKEIQESLISIQRK